MMLDFAHTIPIEIYSNEHESKLTMHINGETKYSNYFATGTHTTLVRFNHSYVDGAKNTLKITYHGEDESTSKYLKVKNILINGIKLNIFNANYKPRFNDDWWSSLDHETKQSYLDSIHGANGNQFGWFGDISWTYYTGVDRRSKMKTRTSAQYDNIDDIVGMKMEWVYQNRQHNNSWELDDKLL